MTGRPRLRDLGGGGGRRRGVDLGVLFLALSLTLFLSLFISGAQASQENFCHEGIIRDAYERNNNTVPFQNKCNAQKYALLEQQFQNLVKLRQSRKQPLTNACMDHVKNFLCLQCSSHEVGKPGSWSLCDSKCEGCKLLPLVVPQTSNMYKVCC